jgi:hypothetical protein
MVTLVLSIPFYSFAQQKSCYQQAIVVMYIESLSYLNLKFAQYGYPCIEHPFLYVALLNKKLFFLKRLPGVGSKPGSS